MLFSGKPNKALHHSNKSFTVVVLFPTEILSDWPTGDTSVMVISSLLLIVVVIIVRASLFETLGGSPNPNLRARRFVGVHINNQCAIIIHFNTRYSPVGFVVGLPVTEEK